MSFFGFLKRLFYSAAAVEAKKYEATKMETFPEWFDRQGIRHFSAGEFERYFSRSRNGVGNSPPPRALWPNILPALRVVDDLREAVGAPITLTSSYRSYAYNKAVGGVPDSQHLQFRALDIQSNVESPHELLTILRQMRADGKFTGGLGLYPTFVHIDTRGQNKNW